MHPHGSAMVDGIPVPGGAYAHGHDTMQVAPGRGFDPGYAPPQLPPPNPALGENMRQRNWAGREEAAYYDMRHSPQPWQHSREQPHPDFEQPRGNPVSQYMRPAGPPQGFDARGRSPSALAAWTPPRSPTGYVRPTYAYNRVAGVATRAPTLYATPGTWPNMGYPGGSNTYIPSWEATGLIIKYTRDPSFFRINRYLKDIKVPRDTGYYLALSGDEPYRVQAVNDYLWADSADAPGGRQERQGFGFQPYRTARYCYPFSLGRKSVVQAEWPILAEHAAMASCKAMTVRTRLNTDLVTNTANWTGTWGTNTGAVSGAWSGSTTTTTLIQGDINQALIIIEQASGGIVADEDALSIVANPQEARAIARANEYRGYIQGSPDALAAITDYRNPNRKYGLAPYLYGLALAVENAIIVTTSKSANVASPPSQVRAYIWPQQYVLIVSKPKGIMASDEQTLDFSTLAGRWYEQMTVESKSDPDNRREIGRVVEDMTMSIQAPQTGYLFTNAS